MSGKRRAWTALTVKVLTAVEAAKSIGSNPNGVFLIELTDLTKRFRSVYIGTAKGAGAPDLSNAKQLTVAPSD